MKKKIKDLTLEEIFKTCDKQKCKGCPFDNVLCGERRFSDIQYFNKQDLEKEVEIDEKED